MDADTILEQERPFVIFYDCCVPKRQFARILRKAILFADHVFVREVFSEEDCDPDDHLFSKVEEKRQAEYPDKICLFITQDYKDFRNQVKRNPALGTTIGLIVLEHCSSKELNWLRATKTAGAVVAVYAKILERKYRKGKVTTPEIFKLFEKRLSKKTA